MAPPSGIRMARIGYGRMASAPPALL